MSWRDLQLNSSRLCGVRVSLPYFMPTFNLERYGLFKKKKIISVLYYIE